MGGYKTWYKRGTARDYEQLHAGSEKTIVTSSTPHHITCLFPRYFAQIVATLYPAMQLYSIEC